VKNEKVIDWDQAVRGDRPSQERTGEGHVAKENPPRLGAEFPTDERLSRQDAFH
jgi:hypothetical protein